MLLRFEGYKGRHTFHAAYMATLWQRPKSTMECKQERRFGATFQRKVKPVRVCRLACPGLLLWDF
jgi:hypothetical protein